jgi:hypothetical protein
MPALAFARASARVELPLLECSILVDALASADAPISALHTAEVLPISRQDMRTANARPRLSLLRFTSCLQVMIVISIGLLVRGERPDNGIYSIENAE